MPVELVHEPGVEAGGLEVIAGTHTSRAERAIKEMTDLFDVGSADEVIEAGREDGIDEEGEVARGALFNRSLLQQGLSS
jgi:hypothetical protein